MSLNSSAAREVQQISQRLKSLAFEILDEDISGDISNISLFLGEIAKRLAICSIQEELDEAGGSVGGQGESPNGFRINEKGS